ncbi:4-hydroxybutyrate dehydrogenase [Bacillus oleivorans]|uniref:4-hydroxybutyrate dehydrogenase n=1 Tax=Bacillus oleivorans TaxID=1448271 RepID=A0A285CJC6_9BACI|nr:iron-containing alcohol dehydrogenase [Bacillus oleivorans]SNX67106.1 4-hydroxybutyrate dehydrogenase [Bacillus oleivorans]
MYRFQLRPVIYELKTVDEFVAQFNISADDYVFTEKFLYEKYLKGKLDCQFLFQDDYGLGEPSDIIIDKIIHDIYGKEIKRIIGIGGGTILDISKLLCIKDASSTEEIFEDQIPLVRDKELILIPTTCGTGCEVTCVSVVDITKRKTKIGKRIEENFADAAVLIEELLDSIPEKVFTYSSVDALIHAMEIFVAPTGNPYNDVFCKSAIEIILSRYKVLVEDGLDKRFDFIGEFLRASTFAGIALSNTVCGAVHAFAMHFGSVHHVPHGESNARFLSGVFNKYAEKSPTGKLLELAEIINKTLDIDTDIRGSFHALEDLVSKLIPKKKLREYGVKEEDIESYVDKVIESQQRLLINNFVPLTKEDLIDIYRVVY